MLARSVKRLAEPAAAAQAGVFGAYHSRGPCRSAVTLQTNPMRHFPRWPAALLLAVALCAAVTLAGAPSGRGAPPRCGAAAG